jgi:hypothetical protein
MARDLEVRLKVQRTFTGWHVTSPDLVGVDVKGRDWERTVGTAVAKAMRLRPRADVRIIAKGADLPLELPLNSRPLDRQDALRQPSTHHPDAPGVHTWDLKDSVFPPKRGSGKFGPAIGGFEEPRQPRQPRDQRW